MGERGRENKGSKRRQKECERGEEKTVMTKQEERERNGKQKKGKERRSNGKGKGQKENSRKKYP